LTGPAPPQVGVALDVHALQVEGWADRGVGRYVSGYSAALARRRVLAAALLAPELPPASGLPNELAAAGLVAWDSAASCRSLIGAPGLVYHLTAPFLHFEPGAPAGLGVVEHWARAGVPRVVLFHDLIPLRAPRHYLHAPGHEETYRARAEWAGGADLVLTNSEHTRQEAIALLGCDPDRVVTIGAGVSPFFGPPDGTDDELWRFHFPSLVGRPFVLTVGGSDARKGTGRAVAAVGLLAARGFDLSLLVVGHLTPAWRAELEEAARASGVADRVYFGGAVDDELLRAAYRRAVVSIMPSLAEGAGLPVLESAACATPALVSDSTALAETAASPAALFDPTDVDSSAGVIGAAVDSADRRTAILAVQQRMAGESTWDAVAGRAVDAISTLAAGSSVPHDWPPRLALVGWPPGRDERLKEVAEAWGGPASVLDPGAIGAEVRAASYDQVVYVFTATPADEAVRAVAGRHPGWLWLWEPVGRLEPLVRRSRGVLVGSAAAARDVRMALRPGVAPPPIMVVDGPAALATTF
jgi:glycosyltransferase involved in cell wall biosynthesis